MSDEQLREAVALAKAGHAEEAVLYAKRYVRENMDDERGWYVLARLIADDKIKREALERVLQLNPFHENALAMLHELDARADSFVFENSPLFDSTPAPVPQTHSSDVFSAATYSDEVLPDVPSGYFEIEQLQAKPAKQASRQMNAAMWELLAGIGMIAFAILFAVGIGYYAYAYQHYGIFGLFGPDLSQEANVSGASIHYPAGWQGEVSDGGFAAVNTDINLLTTGGVETLSANDLLANSNFLEQVYGQDGLQLVVLTPVTPQVLASLQVSPNIAYSSARDYIQQTIGELQAFQNGDLFVANVEEQRIGGRDGVLGSTEVSDEEADLYVTVYVGAVSNRGQEYLFMYVAVGNRDMNHERLVNRILRSIKFTS